MTYLLLTVRWLDGRYHGLLGRHGPPEWPPSPFRLFQALVSGVARRGELESAPGKSLGWLQTLEPPTIVAPRAHAGRVVTHFVPNNDGDKKPDRQDRLKGKTFRPTLMIDSPEIHYLWPIKPEEVSQAQLVCQAARYLTCLGLGIDMAYSNGRLIGSEEAAELFGTRWHARDGVAPDSGLLRVPVFDRETKENTLGDLKRAHQSALSRVEDGKPLNVVEKPRVFGRVFYESEDRPLARPFAAFSILRTDASGFRAFDTARHARTVAEMLRCAASSAAKDGGWSEEKIRAFILGHGASRTGTEYAPVEDSRRFGYLPLPSIEVRGAGRSSVVGSIRRILLTTFADGCEFEIAWAGRALSGCELIDKDSNKPVALLSLISQTESRIRHYTQRSCCWATVTPVVLPGYDDPDHLRRRAKSSKLAPEQQRRVSDRLSNRIDRLLRKAITQAGFHQSLADDAQLEWRSVGFWPGADLANRYAVPDHLKRFPRLHVKLQWRDAQGRPLQVPGPLCLGGGRFYGLGLFVAL